MNSLEFIELYNRFYDFYFTARKSNFYDEDMQKMKDSIDLMYLSIFKRGNEK
jgi:hypothetical protein